MRGDHKREHSGNRCRNIWLEVACNWKGVIQRNRCVFVGYVDNTSADLRQFIAARMRFSHLGTTALIGHV